MSLTRRALAWLKVGAVVPLLVGGAIAVAPSASAAPAAPVAAVAPAASSDAGTDAAYFCSIAYNLNIFVFNSCTVSAGVIQTSLICTDGFTFWGPVWGVGTWGPWGADCTPTPWLEARIYHLA